MSLFKSQNIKARTRPYEGRDDPLSSEPMLNPLSYFSWLPFSGKKIEVQENDIQLLERFGRVSLRTLNFVEVCIQAWHKLKLNKDSIDLVIKKMTYAVKALMQLQACSTNSIIQLRRDAFLAKSKGLSHEHKQMLRHAPILGEKKLFPDTMLIEINKANKASVQEKAFLKVVSGGSFNKKSDASKPKQPATKSAKPTNPKGQNSNWSVPAPVSVMLPPCPTNLTTSVPVTLPRVRSHSLTVSQASSPNIACDYNWSVERAAIADMNATPVGGRLKFKWENWKEFGASKKIVRWLRKGYMLPFNVGEEAIVRSKFSAKSDANLVANYAPDTEKALVLNMMMDTLLKKNYIVKMQPEEQGFFNLVFLRPKKAADSETRMEKRWRLILDVSGLNKFLRIKHFTMETAEKIRGEVTPNSWATSVDLTDAYHHLPIHPHFQNFLAFEVAGVNYKYVACPFGLSPIPQVFTEVMTCIKIHMRENTNSLVFQYLDDWLLISDTALSVLQDTVKFVNICIKLGVIVNPDKSSLEPTQSLVHLGFHWDFAHARLSVPEEKVVEIINLCKHVSDTSRVRLPCLESLQGKLISVEKAVPYGRIHYRNFQKEVVRNVRRGRNNRHVRLSKAAKNDLVWWSKRSHVESPVDCRRCKPDVILMTDASLTGWGIVSIDRTWKADWLRHERSRHINELELLTTLKALRQMTTIKEGDHVQFLIDNRTACCYINRQGGTKSVRLNTIARRVWLLAEQMQLTLSAAYIKGENNVIADMLSRSKQIVKAEWTVGPDTFKWIVENSPWGPPTVDLFANSLTNQLPNYFSPCPDQDAMATDALVSSWPKEVLYAFPPTTIMDRVLLKIQQERPKHLLLLAPYWSMTTWFSTLWNLSTSIKHVPSNVLTLHQPHLSFEHPNPDSIYLALWCIQFQDLPT